MTYLDPKQVNPAANTDTDLATVTTGKQVVSSTICVCNTSNTQATYRIALRPAGAALETKSYIVYDATLLGNESKFFTIGITAQSTTKITVRASTANLAFNAFFVEEAL